MTRRFVLLLVAMALAVTVLPATASAADRQPTMAAQPITDFEDAVRMLDPYVATARDGTVTIDAPDALRAAIDPALLAQLELSAAMAKPLSAVATADAAIDHSHGRDPWCRGRSGFGTRWWGYRLYLNSCQTDNMVRLLNIGASATAVICPSLGIPAGVACGLFAGSVKVLTAVIGYITRGRYGISMSWCWACPLPLIRRQ